MRFVLERLRHLLERRAASFIYHQAYARTLPGVPIDPAQPEEILAFLLDQRLIGRRDILRPLPARLEHLLRVHSAAYLEAVQDAATLTSIFGVPVPEDRVAEILDVQRLIAGGTILATRTALRTGRIAVNLRGGLHHATPERGMGFCVFNDVAVAIARLRARGFQAPVLVIDLDLHDGNGTRAAFAHDPTVHTFSIHNQTWDETPAIGATSVALGAAVTDATYLDALADALPPVVRSQQPGLVIYLAGVDVAADDALGDWQITAAGMLERDQFVIRTVRGANARQGTPLAILVGGGYGSGAWRYSARFFAWLLSGQALEPPDNITAVLERFRPIARQVAIEQLARAEARPRGEADWGLTVQDLPGGSAALGLPRILGHYSRHGLELLCERLGLLERLRNRGFRHPVLDVAASAGRGDTVRVWGDETRRELLIELRLTRSRSAAPGLDTLYVEWLLLQNPQVPFTGRVARLPGQEHPGLGLLAEIAGLLVVMSETLGLDGVVFEPAHYYMAALGQRHLRFLRPEDQARFETFRVTLAGLSLADAEQAIAAGRVISAGGEAVAWRPAPMVLPTSEALARRVSGPHYEHTRLAERTRLSFRLAPASAGATAPDAPTPRTATTLQE